MSSVISIHLSAELDSFLRGGSEESRQPTEAALDFRELLARYKLKPEPLFRDIRERMPEHIWHVACSRDEAEEIVDKLLRIKGVEGVYPKPPEGLPDSP